MIPHECEFGIEQIDDTNSWLRTVDLAKLYLDRDFPDYPDDGFLKYPLPLLRAHGQATRTLAALWSLREVQRYGKTSAKLETIAYLGCLPLDTLTKHLPKLEAAGAIINHGRRPYRTTTLELGKGTLTAFRVNKDPAWRGAIAHLQIQRWWFHRYPQMPFCEMMLWQFYRFRCRVAMDTHSWCVDSFKFISDYLGFSLRTVKAASKELEKAGRINRQRLRYGYAVSIPGYSPAYPLDAVLAGDTRKPKPPRCE